MKRKAHDPVGRLSKIYIILAHIWVPYGVNSIAKLRASDGKVLGTFKVGLGPLGIAFDGANLWVANRNDGTVSKLRASDGKLLGTFSVPSGPYGVAFDGTNIWVTTDFAVTELNAVDGTTLGYVDTQTETIGVAFDGANIWVSEFNINVVHKL